MFKSIYSSQISMYYDLRRAVLGESARKHELCYLRRFDSYLAEHLSPEDLITENFLDTWIGTLPGKSSTVENEVIAIRNLLTFLRVSGQKVPVPVIPKVREDYVPYIFSEAELNRIFDSADNVVQKDWKADPYLVIEFPVIIRLLYSCGLRIGETVKLKIPDVDIENGILRMSNTKGDKHRLVPVSSGMNEILVKYCMAMGLTGTEDAWLFPSSKNDSHISDKAIKRRFEKILKDNGIQLSNRKRYERGPCLHCLRHVFAFRSFAQAEREGRHLDETIPYLSIYLGHESLAETEKYLKFSNELFPESIDAFGNYMRGLLPEVDDET